MKHSRPLSSFLRSLILGMGIYLVSAQASAACASPTGAAGEMKLISDVMYYCASTAWRATANVNTGTACSSPGTIQNRSNVLYWCKASPATWHTTAPATLHGSCAAGQAGYFYYDSSNTYYWFCTGSAWHRLGP